MVHGQLGIVIKAKNQTYKDLYSLKILCEHQRSEPSVID
jgi:hypothetical protein